MKALRFLTLRADLRETNKQLDRIATALEYAIFGVQPDWMTAQPDVPLPEQAGYSTEADLVKKELEEVMGIHREDEPEDETL